MLEVIVIGLFWQIKIGGGGGGGKIHRFSCKPSPLLFSFSSPSPFLPPLPLALEKAKNCRVINLQEIYWQDYNFNW